MVRDGSSTVTVAPGKLNGTALADEARRAFEAGADAIRLPLTATSGTDIERFRADIAAIRDVAPGLAVQAALDACEAAPANWRGLALALTGGRDGADVLALPVAAIYENGAEEASSFYAWAAHSGIVVQHVVRSVRDMRCLASLVRTGIVPEARPQVLVVTGVDEPHGATPYMLDRLLAPLGGLNLDWSVMAHGSLETACLLHAVERGGKVCVGFEVNRTNADATQAASSAERVAEVMMLAGLQPRLDLTRTAPTAMALDGETVREAVPVV